MNKENVGLNGGAWSEETHLKLHAKNFNYGLAEFIVNEIKPNNTLEFGSGLGFLSRYIVDNSDVEESYCIEPNDIKGLYDNEKFPKLLPINIFEDTMPLCLNKTFDFVFSIEVAEHIELDKHKELFDFLVSHTNNWVVFSGAHIGQGGHGHIAERTEAAWCTEFVKRGMYFDEELTYKIREACDEKNINHRKFSTS